MSRIRKYVTWPRCHNLPVDSIRHQYHHNQELRTGQRILDQYEQMSRPQLQSFVSNGHHRDLRHQSALGDIMHPGQTPPGENALGETKRPGTKCIQQIKIL